MPRQKRNRNKRPRFKPFVPVFFYSAQAFAPLVALSELKKPEPLAPVVQQAVAPLNTVQKPKRIKLKQVKVIEPTP